MSMRDAKNVKFNDSTIVPFDIETTGFSIDDKITTITIYIDGKYGVFVNKQDKDIIKEDDMEDNIKENSEIENIEMFYKESEEEVLKGFSSVIEDNISTYDYYLVAYNGERWKGGFDLSFIRTAAQKYDINSVFNGRYYIDLYPIFSKERINTVAPSLETIETNEKEGYHDFLDYAKYQHKDLFGKNKSNKEVVDELKSRKPRFSLIEEWYNNRDEFISMDNIPTKKYKDLVMVHYVLSVYLNKIDEETYISKDIDPFEDSIEAVNAYKNNNFTDLIKHNVADVQKTLDLSTYLSKISMDDINWKELP